MNNVPKVKIIAAVGVWRGRSNRSFSACISICSISFSSPLFSFQDSALLSKLVMVILSCNSSNTAASILFRISLDAIVWMLLVVACTLVFLLLKFSLFRPSLVIVSPRYLYCFVSFDYPD